MAILKSKGKSIIIIEKEQISKGTWVFWIFLLLIGQEHLEWGNIIKRLLWLAMDFQQWS